MAQDQLICAALNIRSTNQTDCIDDPGLGCSNVISCDLSLHFNGFIHLRFGQRRDLLSLPGVPFRQHE